MSSSVEVNGRPLSSTTPSLMACVSFCRLWSKPSTSLSCTSKTARNIGKKHVFLHGLQKVALCRHLLLKQHFPPCMHLHSHSPPCNQRSPQRGPSCHKVLCFSLPSPGSFDFMALFFTSFVPDCLPSTSLSWYSSSSYPLYCVSFNSTSVSNSPFT